MTGPRRRRRLRSLVLTRHALHAPVGRAALRDRQNVHGLSLLGPVDVVSIGPDEAMAPAEDVSDWMAFGLRRRSIWDRVKTSCWVLRPGVIRSVDGHHLQCVRRWLRRRLRQRRYDAVVVEGIALASYIPDLRRGGCRIVFDCHNVESALHADVLASRTERASSPLHALKDRVATRRITEAERRAVRGADVVWGCSEQDARMLERRYGARQVTVVPNTVDLRAYRQLHAAPVDDDWSHRPITLVYPGVFGYSPNADAALHLIRRLLPAVRACGVEARAVLVGGDPTPEMLAAAHDDPSIAVTGQVESVQRYLEQPCVVTLPLRLGSGTRLKVVEALAAGRPVVSTAKGVEGLAVRDDVHLLVREDPPAMARAVLDLWRQPRLRQRLCANALELVRREYSWACAARRIADSLQGPQPNRMAS